MIDRKISTRVFTIFDIRVVVLDPNLSPNFTDLNDFIRDSYGFLGCSSMNDENNTIAINADKAGRENDFVAVNDRKLPSDTTRNSEVPKVIFAYLIAI